LIFNSLPTIFFKGNPYHVSLKAVDWFLLVLMVSVDFACLGVFGGFW
jgi:hypothetical protein